MSGSTFDIYYCNDCEAAWLNRKEQTRCGLCKKEGVKSGTMERNTFGKTP